MGPTRLQSSEVSLDLGITFLAHGLMCRRWVTLGLISTDYWEDRLMLMLQARSSCGNSIADENVDRDDSS